MDVLASLADGGYISGEQRHKILFRMPDASVLGLLLTAAEVLGYLRTADVRDGALTEGSYLSTLGRNVAPTLDCGTNPSGRVIGGAYAVSLLGVIEDAIVQCWAYPAAGQFTAAALSGWLLQNLYRNVLAVLPLEERPQRLAAGFAGMIARAYQLLTTDVCGESNCHCCIARLEAQRLALSSSAGVFQQGRSNILELWAGLLDQIPADPPLDECASLSARDVLHCADPAH